jgi:hypothetical protein
MHAQYGLQTVIHLQFIPPVFSPRILLENSGSNTASRSESKAANGVSDVFEIAVWFLKSA